MLTTLSEPKKEESEGNFISGNDRAQRHTWALLSYSAHDIL
jgi:hypothetical protein